MTPDKRERAIKYLTEEIRSLRMAPQINGCPMTPEWADQLEVMKTCLEAVRSAHFADAGKMQPLNFEQLWKMDGQPVRIVCDEAAKETTPGFEPLEMIVLVEYIKTAGCVILRNNIGGVSEYYSDEELQQDGLTAYAYPPANIDREAWVSVEEKLPDAEEEVRLLCVTSWGCHYQCQGFYVPPGTYRDDSGYSWDWECCEEYDEERDDYLVNPGWYESIHNWDEYSACGIADKVTNWMPLPEEPEDMEKRARGIKKDGT